MSLKNRIATVTVRSAVRSKLAPAIDERRWAQRKVALLPGNIVSDRLQAAVACVVRDLSATGANLDIKLGKTTVINSAAGLPDTFILILPRDECQVDCQVAWRDKATVGVRFLGGLKMMPKRAPAKPLKR